jgi:hypothetical protein
VSTIPTRYLALAAQTRETVLNVCSKGHTSTKITVLSVPALFQPTSSYLLPLAARRGRGLSARGDSEAPEGAPRDSITSFEMRVARRWFGRNRVSLPYLLVRAERASARNMTASCGPCLKHYGQGDSFAELGDAQLHRAGARLPGTVAVAVALVDPLIAARTLGRETIRLDRRFSSRT